MVARMNRLPIEKRCLILQMLAEGMSMRAATRTVGCSINTVTKLLVDAGRVCADYQDEVMRDLPCRRIEVDELWAFCYAKDKRIERDGLKHHEPGAGSVWTWTAICADTRLMPCWAVGDRSFETALPFMEDLASRLKHRVQLTTDAHKPYLEAVDLAFATDVDYAQLVKEYGGKGNRYLGAERIVVYGRPKLEKISTSYVERSNLTIRMGNRRYARQTNAYSKRLAHHEAMLAFWMAHYNLVRVHRTMKTTPAVAAGVEADPWSMIDLVELVESRLPKPNRPKHYRKAA